MTTTKPPTLKEIGARINAHLRRFERDPKINADTQHGKPYHYASAGAAGSRVSVSYVAYQHTSKLTREEALAYLAWLDAGNVGQHFAAKLPEAAPKTTGEYAYVVHEHWSGEEPPKIHRAPVVKRSEKQIKIQDTGGLAFNCRTTINPKDYDDSPEKAIERYRGKLAEERAKLIEELRALETRELQLAAGLAPAWED